MSYPLDYSVIEPIPLDSKNDIIPQDVQNLEDDYLLGLRDLVENFLEGDNCTFSPSPTPIRLHSLRSIATTDYVISRGGHENLGVIRNLDTILPTKTIDDKFGSPRKKLKTCCSVDVNNNVISQDPQNLGMEGSPNIPENRYEADNLPSLPIPTSRPSLVESLERNEENFDMIGKGWHDKDFANRLQSVLPTRALNESSSSSYEEVNEQQINVDFCNRGDDSRISPPTNCEPFHSERTDLQLLAHDKKWNSNFQDLLNFHQAQGHCLVPHKWKENLGLARWVKRQRHQYKLKRDGMHTTLTDSREEALTNLGFVWEPQAARWEEILNDIRDYKIIHGTCNVPSTCTAFPSLALWVKAQRRQYRNFMRGQRSSLTIDRIEKLDGLGFIWNPRSIELNHN